MKVLSLILLVISGMGSAQSQDAPEASIVAALTEERVEIRSDFTGAELVLFGAVQGFQDEDNIVVVVRGPASDMRVMQKMRTFGIWMNRAPIRFEDVPSYYVVASTNPLGEFATFSALRRNAIGTAHVRLSAPETERVESRFGLSDLVVSDLGTQIVDYREAIVRIKARDDLFGEDPDGVEILDGGLFQARVFLPPKTPVGDYVADVYLFRDGQPIAQRQAELEVRKEGLERLVYDLAHKNAIIYGLLCVALAMLLGWGAAEMFRRR